MNTVGSAMISHPPLWCSPIHASSYPRSSMCSISSRSRCSARVGSWCGLWNGARKIPKRIGQSVVTVMAADYEPMASEDALRDLIASKKHGVLVTLKRDGRSQLSNVAYQFKDGVIRISVTDGRAKTKNLRRDPRASFHVTRDDFYAYAVAE